MSTTNEILRTRLIPTSNLLGHTQEELNEQRRKQRRSEVEAQMELQLRIIEGVDPTIDMNQIRTRSASMLMSPTSPQESAVLTQNDKIAKCIELQRRIIRD